jgi:hypothetical protein
VPAYMVCGVTLGFSGEIAFGSFWLAMAWATFVALVCKLFACMVRGNAPYSLVEMTEEHTGCFSRVT